MRTSSDTKPQRITEERAIERLQTMCAKAEHCTFELNKKLQQWGFSSSERSNIIDKLIDTRFVDDMRFAKAYVNDKVKFARWGERKVAAGLAAKHIDSHIARQALSEVDPDLIFENLLYLLRTKCRTYGDLASFETRAALFRFAAARGYLSHAINAAICRLIEEDC